MKAMGWLESHPWSGGWPARPGSVAVRQDVSSEGSVACPSAIEIFSLLLLSSHGIIGLIEHADL